MFVTFTKLPTSNLVLKLFCVSKSLALSTSTKVVPIFSISYPLTYALPGEIPTANLALSPPFADVYIPRLPASSFKCSLTSISNALTV